VQLSVKVNGERVSMDVEPRLLLAQMLRDRLGLTGTHVGCETSYCGACTVLVDGEAVKSCSMLALQAEGRDIVTIEGLGGSGLHPLQESFLECRALQCGFCTPGMIMSAMDLLTRRPDPTGREIREAIDGNLCRCTGYHSIVGAIELAAARMRGEPYEAPNGSGASGEHIGSAPEVP
jgi:carbon-monoxide dehydrogenase small subunit